ncbi:MAG: universal stress protein [Lysobacterales bacterium]|jgi:nucleotide-binding universal stress UspA family protein
MNSLLVVGYDTSECSERALEYAAMWAKSTGNELVLTYVIQWSPYSFNTPQENEERHRRREAEIERAHKQVVDPVVERLRQQGGRARGVIRHGHPAETLKEIARELGASNIVVGRTGASRLKTHLFGSVASTLIQISTIPVTVVP